MTEIHDWASYLIKAETDIKLLNYKLLHKEHEGISDCVARIKRNLSLVSRWVADNTPDKDVSFWYQAGYDAGVVDGQKLA